MRCPTCERTYPKPSRWYAGWVVWANVLCMGNAMAVLLLVSTPHIIEECVREVAVNGGTASSCYPPVGWLLFLGCLLWAAVNVCVLGAFPFFGARKAARKNAERPRILRQIYRAGGKP